MKFIDYWQSLKSETEMKIIAGIRFKKYKGWWVAENGLKRAKLPSETEMNEMLGYSEKQRDVNLHSIGSKKKSDKGDK